MKRSVSVILSCVFMITIISTAFSGCVKAEATNKLITSEWLYLINQKFGFESYSQTEPYLSDITSDNESFDDVQIAFEYYVLPDGYTALNLSDEVSREFCALTLAGAIYTPNLKELSIADYDKLMFPDSVKSVVNYGVMSLDDKGNFKPSEKMGYGEAIECLEKAYYTWANMEYEHNYEFTFAENVIDFSGMSTIEQGYGKTNYVVDDNYLNEQKSWLDNNDFSYDPNKGVVTINNIDEKNIEEGSILVIPESLENPEGLYLKVNKISEENGIYILDTTIPEPDEIFPDGFTYQGTDFIDMTQAIIYDNNGNIIKKGKFEESTSSPYTATPMAYVTNMKDDVGAMGGSVSIPISDKLTFKLDIRANGKFTTGIEYKTSAKTKLKIGKEFSNFRAINSVSTDLTKEMRFGLAYDTKDTISWGGKTDLIKDFDSLKTTGSNISEDMIQKLIDELAQASDDKFDESSRLATAKIPVQPGVFIDIAFVVRFTLEGTIEICLTYNGQGVGVHKRAWSLVPIFNWHTPAPTPYFDMGTRTNESISGSVKAELTLGLNAAASLGIYPVLDIEPAIGVGAKVSATGNYVNASRQPLIDGVPLTPYALKNAQDYLTANAAIFVGGYVGSTLAELDDVAEREDNSGLLLCIDLTVYPIAKVTICTGDSLVGKYIGSLSVEFLGSKSTPLFNKHAELDSGGFSVHNCTLEDRINDGIERGDHIEITPAGDFCLNRDDEQDFEITMLPESKRKIYTLADLVVDVEQIQSDDIKGDFASSSNAVVVQVKDRFNESDTMFSKISKWFESVKNGKKDDKEKNIITVLALQPGNAKIILRTRDNLYKTEPILIHVNTPEEEGISAIQLKTFSASVAINDTLTLTANTIPFGKDESSIFWESDDENIAVVDTFSGEIKGITEGVCTVRAYIPGHDEVSVYCLITVTKDYTTTNAGINVDTNHKSWIKIEGLPVMILESA